MNTAWINFAVAVIISLAIAVIGYRKRSLSESGLVGAVLVGTTIATLGGLLWLFLLLLFFASGSALSHYKEADKKGVGEKFEKSGRRDLGQTLANGGVGMLLAVLNFLIPSPVWLAAYLGSICTVTADTWATELGVLAPTEPRLITTGQVVEKGTSGGITAFGTLAGISGSLFISFATGISAAIFQFAVVEDPLKLVVLILGGGVAGLGGMLFDSLLGATVQGIYYCPTCETETERRVHSCGTKTVPLRGWQGLGNDLVNFISSLVGALIAACVYYLVL